MEGLISQIASILSGDMVSLALKIGLLVGIPLVIGIVYWVMQRKAASEKLEADRREAQEREKKDSIGIIDDNQKDSSQGKTDQEKAEEDRQKLLDELKQKV